VSAGGGT